MNAGSPIKPKPENIQTVYRYIQRHANTTKQSLFAGTGLSLPTIKQIISVLEEEALITKGDKKENTGGRNALSYKVNESGRYAIGVYLSQHHLTSACLDLSGRILTTKRLKRLLNLQSEDYLMSIGNLVIDTVRTAGVDEKKLLGAGIAVPSCVSADGERIQYGMTTDFTGITRTVLSRYVPYDVRMYHDSRAAGFSEVFISPEIRNVVYLNLNNSVGSSVFANGQPYYGNSMLSGEIGHMIIDPGSTKKCYCGHYGCLDTVCSAGVLDACTDGDLGKFFMILKEKDEQAIQLWNTYLDNLALAIHNIRMLLDCNVIIGGYVGSFIGEYMEELYRRLDAMNAFSMSSRTVVSPCRFNVEATAAGSAFLIIDDFINSL